MNFDEEFDGTATDFIPQLVGDLRAELPGERVVAILWQQYFRYRESGDSPDPDRLFLLIDQIPNLLDWRAMEAYASESVRHAECILFDPVNSLDERLAALRIVGRHLPHCSDINQYESAYSRLEMETRPELWAHIKGILEKPFE